MAEVAIKAVEAVFDWRAYLKEEFGLDVPPAVDEQKQETGEGIMPEGAV